MGIIKPLLLLLILYASLSATCALAKPPLTADELLTSPELKGSLQSVLDGEIVTIALPERENKNELNVVMMLLVPSSLEKTATTLQQANAAAEVSSVHAIPTEASPSQLTEVFKKAAFSSDEAREAQALLEVIPDGRFHLSADEISMVRKHAEAYKNGGGKVADAAHTMSRAMAEVLQGRYQAYREKGIQGLAPYQMNVSQLTEPALDLVAATESMALIKERFPLYFSCLRAYPAECSTPFVHQFFWTKQIEENRPLFALKHCILDIQSEYALITERQYYISHTLDSLQVVIGCLPYRQGTLVVLLNQAFTEKVNVAIGRSIAKGFGRKVVEEKIRPIFENLRSALAH